LAASAAIAADYASPNNMVDVGALDMNAKIGRAQYCESAAFFAMCLPHVDEAPLPMSGEDDLLLRVGAVEGAAFVVDRDVDADRDPH
jgi:hypothetical protein